MFTLQSPAREVIEGCRAEVLRNGDGLDGCYWAERGLEVCGEKSFREVIDLGGDMHMMAAQVLILPYLQPLFDRACQVYVAKACVEHPTAAAWLLHIYGEQLPRSARQRAERAAPRERLAGLALCPGVQRLREGRSL